MAQPKNSCSSFSGIIDEIPEISVDNFERHDKKVYFLSHCHTDHTHGLFNCKFLENLVVNDSYVYMSEISAHIIRHEKSDENFSSLHQHIRPLKLGDTIITIPGEKDLDFNIIKVSLIPAGHCFGSVMILFRKHNKNILYTGDFRMNPNDLDKYAQFHVNGDPLTLNTLYVDTTFQDEKYETFPKRSESVDYTVSEISKWLKQDEKNVVALNTSAKYGYEYIFNEIYKQLNVKVYVNDEKWRLYSQFPKQLRGISNNINDTKIHLCQNRYSNQTHKPCHPNDNTDYNYLHIRFSAMTWQDYQPGNPVGERDGNNIKILFATHCSRRELLCFIHYFNPKRIVGFPNKFECSPISSDPVVVRKRKCSKKECVKKVPRKVDRDLLLEMFK